MEQKILNQDPAIKKAPELEVVNYDTVMICAARSPNDHKGRLVSSGLNGRFTTPPDSNELWKVMLLPFASPQR